MRGLIPVLGADPYAATLGGYSAGGGAPAAENTVAMSPAFSAEPTVFDATITTGSVSAVLPLVTSSSTLFATTVTTTISAVLPLVTSSETIFDTTVTPGGAPAAGFFLEGTADLLLLETGDKWLVESGSASEITDLTANTTPADTDLVLMVDDPGGTPASQKMTLSVLRTYLLG